MLFGASFLAYISAERELNNQVNEFLLTRSRETEEGLSVADLPVDSDLAFGIQFGTINALLRADASIQILEPGATQVSRISGSILPVGEEDFRIAEIENGDTVTRATFDRLADNGETYRVLVSSNPRGALMVGRSLNDVTQTLDGLRGWLVVISVVGSLGAAFVVVGSSPTESYGPLRVSMLPLNKLPIHAVSTPTCAWKARTNSERLPDRSTRCGPRYGPLASNRSASSATPTTNFVRR